MFSNDIAYKNPNGKSRKENPQKLTQLSSRSHPRHLVGKRTAQKEITIDTTSDSQVNSNFPNRWSPASLTFNNFFYLFLYLYITWITTNNNAPHLKSPKNQKQKSRLGRPAIKITWGLELVCGRPTLALSSVSCLIQVHRKSKQVTDKQREMNIGLLVTFNTVSSRRRRKEILKNNWVNNP